MVSCGRGSRPGHAPSEAGVRTAPGGTSSGSLRHPGGGAHPRRRRRPQSSRSVTAAVVPAADPRAPTVTPGQDVPATDRPSGRSPSGGTTVASPGALDRYCVGTGASVSPPGRAPAGPVRPAASQNLQDCRGWVKPAAPAEALTPPPRPWWAAEVGSAVRRGTGVSAAADPKGHGVRRRWGSGPRSAAGRGSGGGPWEPHGRRARSRPVRGGWPRSGGATPRGTSDPDRVRQTPVPRSSSETVCPAPRRGGRPPYPVRRRRTCRPGR